LIAGKIFPARPFRFVSRTFRGNFPLIQDEANMVYKSIHPVYAGPLAGQRILVVDDAEEDRMLLSDFLLRHGARLYVARDGQDGYRKAQNGAAGPDPDGHPHAGL
jgi:PleD family two-component response regulator